LLNRYRSGLYLWSSPFDGFQPWVYNHQQDRKIYEVDTVSPGTWKYMGMVYPGDRGVVGTIGWEGYREGIDDLRYVGTLAAQLLKAKELKLAEGLRTRAKQLGDAGKPEEAERLLDWVRLLSEADALLESPVKAAEMRLAGRTYAKWPEVLDGDALDTWREDIAEVILELAMIRDAQSRTNPRPLDTRELAKDGLDASKRVNTWQVNRLFPNPFRRSYPYGWNEFPAALDLLERHVKDGQYREGVWLGYRLRDEIDKRLRERRLREMEDWALKGKMFTDWSHCLQRYFGATKERKPSAAEQFEARITGDPERLARITGASGERWREDLDTLLELPTEVPFRPDPDVTGVEQKWFSPDFDDSSWAKISTSNWIEGQGYDLTDGYLWYRFTFAMPAHRPDRKVYALFRGVDEGADVYVDGKLAESFCESPSTFWVTPFLIDLTSVKPQTKCVIAVRVVDNFLGGGIYKPVLIIGEK